MSSQSFTGTACGKIILLGEHAVVHGTRAVAVALRKGARIKATRAKGDSSLLVQNWSRHIRVGDGSREGAALQGLLRSLGSGTTPVHLAGMVDIPSRSGLGSSAALAAAAARSVCGLFEIDPSYEVLFEATLASENVFHGVSSGIDVAMALNGGSAVFSRAEGAKKIELPTLPILVVHSKDRGSTDEMVAEFARVLEGDGKEGRERLNRISTLVDKGMEALERNDLFSVGQAMTENHELLARFGVSSPNLDCIVRTALSAGALGAKMTGGGGGGCAIVLIRPEDTGVERAIKAAGFEVVARL